MGLTTREKQERHRARKYKAGLKELRFWVKRKDLSSEKVVTYSEFVKTLKKLTKGWDKEKLSHLYNSYIKILKGKKEEEKLKKRK